MDLSKVFDCILNDLVISKLDAYRFDKTMLSSVYSELFS